MNLMGLTPTFAQLWLINSFLKKYVELAKQIRQQN